MVIVVLLVSFGLDNHFSICCLKRTCLVEVGSFCSSTFEKMANPDFQSNWKPGWM